MARAVNAGAAMVRVFADTDPLKRGLKRAQRQIRAFAASIKQIGLGLIKFGSIIAAPILLALRIYSQFADQMAIVAAVTGATGAAFEALTEKAKELGRTTSFTARQVAGAMIELGRAGFTTTEILRSISPVLNLARATATDLSEATNLAAGAMRSFGLDASQMERVVDVLAATTNNSALILTELGEALKFVAPLARITGEGIEETSAAIGILADNAIKGSRAGTALARAYKNITKEAQQESLKKIGVNAADANNNLRPIADILGDIGVATKQMGSAARLRIFENLFGRGTAAAVNLAKSTSKIKSFTAELKNAGGEAQRVSDAMDRTLGGSFRLFISALEGVAIEIGVILAPAVSAIVRMFTKALGAVVRFIKANKGLILTITAVSVALILVGASLLGLGIAINVILFVVSGLISVFTLLTTVIGAVLSPLGLVAIGLGVVVLAILKFTAVGATALSFLSNTFGTLFENVKKVLTAITNALLAGDVKLAADILWLSLKVVFLKGTLELLKVWSVFSSTFLQLISDTFFESKTQAIEFWNDIKSIWIKAGDALLIGLKGFAAAFAGIWDTLKTTVMSLFVDDAEAQRAFDELEKRNSTRINALIDDIELIQKGQERALAGVEEERAEQIAGIGVVKPPSVIDKQISVTQKALAKSIKDLQTKVGDGLELGGVDFEKFRDEVNKLVDTLLGRGGRGGQAELVETRGFFGTRAIERAGASTASSRAQRAAITTAQNSVKTAANTKKTAQNTSKPFLFSGAAQ